MPSLPSPARALCLALAASSLYIWCACQGAPATGDRAASQSSPGKEARGGADRPSAAQSTADKAQLDADSAQQGAAADAAQKATGRRGEGISVRLALLPTLDAAPFFFAARHGYFTDAGAHVTITTYAAQWDADTALLGTSADFALSDPVRTAFQRGRGAKVIARAAFPRSYSLVACGKLRLRTAQQMAKRLVGVARFTAADYLSEAMLSGTTVQASDVFRPQINDLALRAQMLNENQLDAAMLPEPWASLAVAAGHKRIYTSKGDEMPACLTMRSDCKQGERALQALLSAYNRAVDTLALRGAAAFHPLLTAEYHIAPQQLRHIKLPHYAPAAPLLPAVQQRADDFLRRRGAAVRK